MGAIPYTPVLSKTICQIQVWKQVIRRCRGQKTSWRHITRLARRSEVTLILNVTIEQANENLRQAYQAYHREASSNKMDGRALFLEEKAAQSKEMGLISLASHYRQLFKIESIRLENRRLNSVFRSERCSLDFIIGPGRDGIVIQAESKDMMEEVAECEKIRRFIQANQTPFLVSPLVDDVGLLAERPAADRILEGSYIPSRAISHFSTILLESLHMVPNVAMDSYREWDDCIGLIEGWRKVKEYTSSAPSGLHMGQSSSIFQDNDLSIIDA